MDFSPFLPLEHPPPRGRRDGQAGGRCDSGAGISEDARSCCFACLPGDQAPPVEKEQLWGGDAKGRISRLPEPPWPLSPCNVMAVIL